MRIKGKHKICHVCVREETNCLHWEVFQDLRFITQITFTFSKVGILHYGFATALPFFKVKPLKASP